MRVTVKRDMTHLCPYRDEVDEGEVEASWEGDTVELHALSAFLDGFADKSVTHEQITEYICDFIKNQETVKVAVETRWHTAGMDVTVVQREAW